MIAIKINDIEYTNIASCTPEIVYDFYYDVQTLDGKRHKDIKGKRTNYNVVFYNKDLKEYDKLKKNLLQEKTVLLEVPNGANGVVSAEFYPTINGENLKGKLWIGDYYFTALSVTFEKVGYDG